ncbi:MAG: hypothetical protein M4579_002090 [Chaenotheca gracillima]|nr:MAG: hypothetical protein M4579_002090 [Chaenotheca gracillima]
MGRELQKKKNKSSISRVRQKPKSKKVAIKSSPLIAANWNSKETFTQNYRRLGLTSRLNAPTGGIEKRGSANTSAPPTNPATDSLAIPISANSNELIPTEARIERDADGNIIRVIHPGSSSRPNPLNDPLNELSDTEMEYEAGSRPVRGKQTDVVAQMEEEASLEAPKKPRTQSKREEEWMARLVEKHGDDYRSMFWDKKLNPMQQSEADIKKRIQKWKRTEKEME